MKVLDRYILTRFLYNFVSSFLIIVLIFIFQTIWLYIDEIAGKGLSIWVIVKFVALMLPNLIPLILPLTVVLSSIMTLGAFAESYEFAAMKASGVSLLKGTRTLIVFMFLLSVGVFFTSNNLQPWAHRKAGTIRDNIKNKQPSLAISEGIFNNVQSFSIKVQKKTGENGEFLHDIIIHQNDNDNVNRTVIKAKEGELIGESKIANVLQLILKDGTYYKEVKNAKTNITFPFAKSKFDTYTLNIDVSSLNQEINFDANERGDSYKTMNVRELSYSLDSLLTDYKQDITEFGESFYRRLGVNYIIDANNTLHFQKDTPEKIKDTIRNIEELKKIYQEKDKLSQVYNLAKDNNKSLWNNLDFKVEELQYKDTYISVYRLTLSDKFALAITCFVLFFVAAPLGALIRKGGIGLPLVVAIGLFLSYYFLGMLTKNMGTNGGLNPVIAPWIPTFILFPLGLYLTIRVNEDQPVFQLGEFISRIKTFFKKNKENSIKKV
ncbi:MAG: LptF/LptG family permease [Capnocytophaga sp.]|nr:LptF/LptG family permease [Capnocytophaga sp.]